MTCNQLLASRVIHPISHFTYRTQTYRQCQGPYGFSTRESLSEIEISSNTSCCLKAFRVTHASRRADKVFSSLLPRRFFHLFFSFAQASITVIIVAASQVEFSRCKKPVSTRRFCFQMIHIPFHNLSLGASTTCQTSPSRRVDSDET